MDKIVLMYKGKEYHTTDDVLRRVVALAGMKLAQYNKPNIKPKEIDMEARRFIDVCKDQMFG